MKVEVAECPEQSQGLLKRLYNLLWAGRLQADVYHITGDVHYLALATPAKRTILTIHDVVFLNHPSRTARWVLWLFWLYLPVRFAKVVTVISQATRDEVLRYIPRSWGSKIQVVPNCIDPSYQYLPKPFNRERPRVLLIGTKANKNQERALTALQAIDCDIHLIGEKKEQLQALIQSLQLEVRWDVRLSDDEMRAAYQQADLLLFVSTAEGFGLPVLEAQAIGRPVVTSNRSSLPEVAAGAACLVDPLDIEAIRTGVLRVIENDTYQSNLVERGLENAKRFQPGAIANQYATLYRQLVGGQS